MGSYKSTSFRCQVAVIQLSYGQFQAWAQLQAERSVLDVHHLAVDDAALRRSERGSVPALWGPRNQGMRPVALVRGVPCGHGRAATWNHVGSLPEQRWSLRARELPLGDEQAAGAQQTAEPHHRGRRKAHDTHRMERDVRHRQTHASFAPCQGMAASVGGLDSAGNEGRERQARRC